MKRATTRESIERPADANGERLIRSLIDTAHEFEMRLEDALREAGLSASKYWLLQQLAESAEPLTLSRLATGQRCAASNITQLVDRLESDGLVRRVEQTRDRRSKCAELTAAGRKRQAEGAREVARVQTEFLSSLSAADRKALARGLAAAWR